MYKTMVNGIIHGTYDTLEEARAAMDILVKQGLKNLALVVPKE